MCPDLFPLDREALLALATLFLSGLPLANPGGASAQGVAASVDSTESRIDYTGTAPMHDWTGTSRSV